MLAVPEQVLPAITWVPNHRFLACCMAQAMEILDVRPLF